MSDKSPELKTGWYLVAGRPAFCIVREEEVEVIWSNNFACVRNETFRHCGAVPCEKPKGWEQGSSPVNPNPRSP